MPARVRKSDEEVAQTKARASSASTSATGSIYNNKTRQNWLAPALKVASDETTWTNMKELEELKLAYRRTFNNEDG